jgi:hypothetical protein
LFDRGYGNSVCQPVVIRENEGVSLHLGSPAPLPAVDLLVTFRVQGGATWAVRIETCLTPDNHSILAVWNGTWSGVILELLQIEASERAEDLLPVPSVELIDGIEAGTGAAAVPLAMDSASSLPSQVQVVVAGKVYLAGYERGAIMVSGVMRRACVPVFGVATAVTGSLLAWDGVEWWGKVCAQHRDFAPLVLHQGDGIAVLNRQSDSFATGELTLTFQTKSTGGGVAASTHGYVA